MSTILYQIPLFPVQKVQIDKLKGGHLCCITEISAFLQFNPYLPLTVRLFPFHLGINKIVKQLNSPVYAYGASVDA